MATSFSGGRCRSTLREPPTIGKQLVNFITCDCESSAPFFVIYKVGLVIGLYELLGNPTTWLIEPPGPFRWSFIFTLHPDPFLLNIQNQMIKFKCVLKRTLYLKVSYKNKIFNDVHDDNKTQMYQNTSEKNIYI